MTAKCTRCEKHWNISVEKNLEDPYVCPHCSSRQKEKRPGKDALVKNQPNYNKNRR